MIRCCGGIADWSDMLANWLDMRVITLITFAISLPLAGICAIWFAHYLLIDAIPKHDSEMVKARTDIFMTRLAFATCTVGLVILLIWALVLGTLAVLAGVRVLG